MNSNALKKNEFDSAKSWLFSSSTVLFLRSFIVALLALTSFMGCAVRMKGFSNSSSESTTTSSAPVVSISSPSSATVIQTSGTVTFTITTTGSTSVNLTSAQVTLNTTGGATCTKSVTNGTTTSATVTLSNCSGAGGTVSISISAGIASNADGDLSGSVGPSSAVTVVNSAFTQTWPFNALSEASYSFDTSKMDFTGGVCRLTATDQIDSDNTASGFGGGTLTGAAWDASNGYVRLGNSGGCDGSSTACANQTASSIYELSSTWTPQWANIISYWKMNGNWNDSKASNNGTANNGATFTTSAKFGSHAGTFDGVDDYVDFGNIAAMNFGAGSHSLSAWIKPVNANQTGFVVTKSNGGTTWDMGIAGADSFSWPAGKKLVFLMYQDAGNHRGLYTTADVADGNWHHVLITASSTDVITVYVDGVSVAYTMDHIAGAWPQMNSTNAVQIGHAVGLSNYYNGNVDEVAVWNVALTASEVQTIYSRQSTKYSGTIVSRVMDAFATGMSWTTFSWVPTLPFLKELTDYASGAIQNETSTDYSELVGSTGATGDNNLMTGIVALWHLNETAGTTGASSVIDESGQGKHGTPTNVTFGAPGKLGTMASFNGTSSGISFPAIDLTGTNKVSISLWYNSPATPVGNSQLIIEQSTNYNSFSGTFAVYHDVNGKINCGLMGDVGYSVWISTSVIQSGVWNHIVCTYDTSLASNESKGYINGVLDGAINNNSNNTNNFSNREFYMGSRNLSTRFLKASVDEVAIWTRALHTSEIKQLYRRGANRIKHQVRVCTASDCSDDSTGANWKGPDGTNQTYFSELNNNSVPLAMTGDVQKGLPSLLFSNFTSPVGTSRYFQYRTILESDDTSSNCNYGAGATKCSPELKSVTVDPIHYDSSSPTVIGKTGVSYITLATFTQTLGSSCASGISYNLGVGASAAAATWYWWDATANAGAGGWVTADGTVAKSNSAATINTHAATFGTQVGTGTVYFKAFLKSSGTTACELDKLDLTGQQ